MTRHSIVAIYDGDCGVCSAMAAWLVRRDRRGHVVVLPIRDTVEVGGRCLLRADLEREMHVVDASGRIYRGFAAWRRIARELPLLRPLTPFLHAPGVSRVGDAVYRCIAGHRHGISRLLGLRACPIAEPDITAP